MNLEQITAGYLGAILEMENTSGRFSNIEKRKAFLVCKAFVQCCGALAPLAMHAYESPMHFGTDFWLSRSGSGVGFGDRLELTSDVIDLRIEGKSVIPKIYSRGRNLVEPDGTTLGELLDNIAYGTRTQISPFAYPHVEASRGWTYVSSAADLWAQGLQSTWKFWQKFKLEK